MIHELLGQLAARKETFSDNPLSVEQMGELVDMVQCDEITGACIDICYTNVAHPSSLGTSGKTLLRQMVTLRSTASPLMLAKELGLLAVSDDDGSLLKNWCLEAIEALPEEVQKVRDGNLKVMNRIMGKVMQLSGGRVKAGDVRQMLEDLLLKS